jgi:hypothetical protein
MGGFFISRLSVFSTLIAFLSLLRAGKSEKSSVRIVLAYYMKPGSNFRDRKGVILNDRLNTKLKVA